MFNGSKGTINISGLQSNGNSLMKINSQWIRTGLHDLLALFSYNLDGYAQTLLIIQLHSAN